MRSFLSSYKCLIRVRTRFIELVYQKWLYWRFLKPITCNMFFERGLAPCEHLINWTLYSRQRKEIHQRKRQFWFQWQLAKAACPLEGVVVCWVSFLPGRCQLSAPENPGARAPHNLTIHSQYALQDHRWVEYTRRMPETILTFTKLCNGIDIVCDFLETFYNH